MDKHTKPCRKYLKYCTAVHKTLLKKALPAHVMYFWISVKVVTILTDSVQLGKDSWGVHTPTPQVHVASFVVYPEPMF